MTRILLVQDIMARYRVDIFEELTAAMAALGHELTIATGRFDESARVNHQLIVEKQWSAMHHVEVPGRTLGPLRILNLSEQLAQVDAVIVTAALASNSWWSTAIRRAVRQRNLIMLMMGHGRDLNSREKGRRLSDLAYTFVTQFGDGYLGYTEASRRIVTQLGMPAQRIEVFGQSKDLEPLIHDVRSQTAAQRQALRRKIGLKKGPVACFVGRLTAYKNLPWLVESFDQVQAALPKAQLLIIGDGPERQGLEAMAEHRPWLHLVGAQYGEGLGAHLALADLQTCPGAVGMSLLDGFAAGHPLITVVHPGHGPDVEYLKPGINGLLLPRDKSAYARALIEIFSSPERLEALQAGATASLEGHGSKAFAARFAGATDRLLKLGRRSLRCRARGFARGLRAGLTEAPELTFAHPPEDPLL